MKVRLIQSATDVELVQIHDLLARYDLAMPDLRTTMFIVAEQYNRIVCVMCIKIMTHAEPVAMLPNVARDIDWQQFYSILESFMAAYKLPEYMIITPNEKIGKRLESFGMRKVDATPYIKVLPW